MLNLGFVDQIDKASSNLQNQSKLKAFLYLLAYIDTKHSSCSTTLLPSVRNLAYGNITYLLQSHTRQKTVKIHNRNQKSLARLGFRAVSDKYLHCSNCSCDFSSASFSEDARTQEC